MDYETYQERDRNLNSQIRLPAQKPPLSNSQFRKQSSNRGPDNLNDYESKEPKRRDSRPVMNYEAEYSAKPTPLQNIDFFMEN